MVEQAQSVQTVHKRKLSLLPQFSSSGKKASNVSCPCDEELMMALVILPLVRTRKSACFGGKLIWLGLEISMKCFAATRLSIMSILFSLGRKKWSTEEKKNGDIFRSRDALKYARGD
ncbi:hypothetical protein MPTK1_7g16510 [Marchantia polymorpha subsp. ruderalis]|uniref:Uncharacterized protein n=2 Tax=Marchantia polymorpha TaxID=3197 RepID=A0AAF6C0D9_MARPO|nr:hypothetical protein MARPO_0123s0033 [Marchantia polymorpha]BBN17723.1 hypothetical protein Mp_7g16510 [Marchantia polymorpha subsp. ruderalis]|eukprot:PTQ30546.1 hypothetical protein MARPO_0123s0033 [Marchantia polymorpha]